MESLNSHYRSLLGLDEFWQVREVSLSVDEKRVCQFRSGSEPLFRSGLRRLAGCRVVFLSQQRRTGERLWRSGCQVSQGMGRPVDWHRYFVAAYSGLRLASDHNVS